jgi:predicted RNase H-like nuclease (RuvC/YqgF family)
MKNEETRRETREDRAIGKQRNSELSRSCVNHNPSTSLHPTTTEDSTTFAFTILEKSPTRRAAISLSATLSAMSHHYQPSSQKTRHYANLSSKLQKLQNELKVTEGYMEQMSKQLDGMSKFGAYSGAQ